MIKRIGIIGRGAIGALYGALFMQHGCQDIVFIVDEERKKRYLSHPVTINQKPDPFTYITKGEPLDLIMICTKASGLNSALNQIRDFIHPQTIILSCLNGISSEEICQKRYPNQPIIRCIVQGMDSTYLNHAVDFAHVGQILIGAENTDQEKIVQQLVQCFETYSIPYRVCDDIVREQWNKLMLNCGINQVCAAHQTGYGACQTGGIYQEEFIQAMKEVQAVAHACGIDLTDQDIITWIKLVDSLRPDGMPSMAQDIQARRKTELSLFSGTIVPLAKSKGIQVPVLEHLMKQIQDLESTF